MTTESEILVLQPEEFLPITKQSGLEKAEIYAATFAPFMIKVKELSNKAAAINKENPGNVDAKLAREIRLAMVKNRTDTSKKKDESKAALLAEGNLIQNLHNVVINTSQLIEAELTAVEKHAEIKEAARVEALKKERAEMLAPFVDDANIFPLGTMSAQQFEMFFEGQKLAHQQKIEQEQKAEAQRLADLEAKRMEDERIRKENERLKAEAEEKEKQLEAERAEAQRITNEERQKNEAELLRLKKENDAKIDAERKKREEIESELKVKQEKERMEADRIAKAEAEKRAAEKKAAKAPDKTKIQNAIAALPAFSVLDLKTTEAQQTADLIRDKYAAFIKWANDLAENI